MTTSNQKLLFSFVKYGPNICEICHNECHYKVTKYWDMANTTMELFRCGHGICRDCFGKLPKPFHCPFCRDSGRWYKTPGGVDNTNTLREYIQEFGLNTHLIPFSNHIFVRLHKQIYQNGSKLPPNAKPKNFPRGTTPEGGRSKKFPSETKTPQSHTCPHCAKNKFTSDYQLSIHIKAKH